jgi:hypothetical protein
VVQRGLVPVSPAGAAPSAFCWRENRKKPTKLFTWNAACSTSLHKIRERRKTVLPFDVSGFHGKSWHWTRLHILWISLVWSKVPAILAPCDRKAKTV